MTAQTLHDSPVDDLALWQRPEHLAAHLGVTVRTLRKWVSRGRAERTRGHRGEAYYRLIETLDLPGPVPSGAGPEPPRGDAPQETRLEQLQEQIAAAQVEGRALRTRTEAALQGLESARQDNTRLQRELEYERELASLPWWASRRRRELTLPMVPQDAE